MVYIGTGAFRQCFSLETITLPQSVKYINTGAFQNSGLKNITINADVRALNYYKDVVDIGGKLSLSDDLFMGCKQLESITAPAQLLFGERDSDDVSIDSRSDGRLNQFLGATALKTINVNGVNPGTNGSAWAMGRYDSHPIYPSSATEFTFTALTNVNYLNGCYNSQKLNTFHMSTFEAAFSNVVIAK